MITVVRNPSHQRKLMKLSCLQRVLQPRPSAL